MAKLLQQISAKARGKAWRQAIGRFAAASYVSLNYAMVDQQAQDMPTGLDRLVSELDNLIQPRFDAALFIDIEAD